MKALNMVIALLLSNDVSIELKKDILDRLHEAWIKKPYHINLIAFCRDEVAKGINPDLITCSSHFRTNKLFTDGFKISDLIKYASLYNPEYLTRFYELVNIIESDHSLEKITEANQEITQRLLSGNTNIDEMRGIMEGAISETQIAPEVHESNDSILDTVILKHYKAQDGESPGLDLGFFTLEQKVLLEPVDMMVIAARPSMGKTAFGVSVLLNLAFDKGEKVKFISLEMSKDQMMRRVVSQYTGVPAWKLKYGKCSPVEINKILHLKTHTNWNNFEIIEGSNSSDNIYYMASKWKMNDECTVIIVDYLQKLTCKKFTKKFDIVTYSSNKMKEISQDFGIPVICLAQLSRANEQRGGDKRPLLSDLRDSGEIEQDASIIGFLHRPDYYGQTHDEQGEILTGKGEFIIAKNREGELGIFDFTINQDTIRWIDGVSTNKVQMVKPDEIDF